ncbi:hypothetical protein DQ04_04371040 [Trypanosoma grayi]|uniref:hypothetical protein n=1 Tax=Trypanosoma grayi TaxID=71804 RepID=UPI0004F46664|nr:hypothetical protein DQ04_04371040 [Trypanosoma grayi]KEG09968.1 hypothetical protein DQ04_04371040 [Trypanosoma grayi]
MRTINRSSLFLDAPVAAIAGGAQWLCLAVGNRVLAVDARSPASSVSVVGDDPGAHRNGEMWLVAELPDGAVISTLEQHVTVGAEAAVVVVIGSGDRVYAASLLHKVQQSVTLVHPAFEDSARILQIRSLGPGAGVLVLTAFNSAFLFPDESLAVAHVATPITLSVVRYVVDGLGIALAADAVAEVGSGSIAVFAGTYAGAISAWRVPAAAAAADFTKKQQRRQGGQPVVSGGTLPVLSCIKAHRPGCAVFAVKALTVRRGGTTDSVCFCVATCSDDRSASLYVATAVAGGLAEGMAWVCCWRGSGASFARRRVFDVSLHLTSGDDDDDPALLLAAGGEDGTVHALSFRAQDLAVAARTAAGEVVAPVTLLHRSSQHDGRGVYKVALLSAVNSTAAAVVSCGFDGAAHCTPLPPQRPRTATLVWRDMKRRRHVRGVACDEQGALLACTEDELIIAPLDAQLEEEGEQQQQQQRIPLPTAEAGSAKRELPSCISAVAFQPRRPLIALVGTTCGNVYGVPYSAAATTREQKDVVEEEEEKVHSNVAVLLCGASPTSSSSKVLLLRGVYWNEHLLLASVHADRSLVVSAVRCLEESPVVWMAASCPGVHTTALSMCVVVTAGGGELPLLCIFVGDDEGGLSIHLTDLTRRHEATTLPHHERLFQHAVASVQMEATPPLSVSARRVTAVSVEGEWRVFLLDTAARRVDIRPVSCPLRLPWRISSVLACSSTVAVTLFGNDVSVHARRSCCFSWQQVAQYHGVKAPRLLSATIPTATAGAGDLSAFVCHCSDGARAEWHACSSANGTRVLHGGATIGREYNTALFLPSPVSCFLCGSENSMITAMSLQSTATRGTDLPLTFSGPHDSNILAMALCGSSSSSRKDTVRFVTAGGLATLALWEWSARHSWSVVAHVSQPQQQQKQNSAGEGTDSRGVPRFLSVCVTCEDIVVGSSDGALKVFALTDTLALRREMLLCPSVPKPVTAVVTLSAADRLVVAGDTNGVVAVCDVASGAVLSHHSWAKAAVNALAVGLRLQDAAGMWRVLAAMDSGDVVLLHVGVAAVDVVCMLRVGLTAARGVSWLHAPQEDVAVAVNDERLVYLRAHDASTAAAAAAAAAAEAETVDTAEPLCVTGHRRVNVRGISGLAVASATACMVVGQGVEVLPLSGGDHSKDEKEKNERDDEVNSTLK